MANPAGLGDRSLSFLRGLNARTTPLAGEATVAGVPAEEVDVPCTGRRAANGDDDQEQGLKPAGMWVNAAVLNTVPLSVLE